MKKLIWITLFPLFLLPLSCSFNSHTNVIERKKYQVIDNIITLEEDASLKIILKDTKDNSYLLDTIHTPNDIPKLIYTFTHEIKGQPYIFAGISYYEDYRDAKRPYINWEKYYTTLAYKCNISYQCKYDKKISNFFGSGGVLVDYNTNNILTSYFFKEESKVKKILRSDLFSNWLNNKPIVGCTVRKTELKEDPTYNSHIKLLLPKSTSFIVNRIDSGWLRVTYNNDNNKIKGWIKYEDTNLYI